MKVQVEQADIERLKKTIADQQATLKEQEAFMEAITKQRGIGVITAGPRLVEGFNEWVVKEGEESTILSTPVKKTDALPRLDPTKLKVGASVLIAKAITMAGPIKTLTEVLPEALKVQPKVEQFRHVNWDDIGGLEEQKEELLSLVETILSPVELHKAYGITPPKGILFSGPPGNGKTLLARALATMLMELAGAKAAASAFALVSGPELLSPWVGVAESNIRGLFEAGRKHYKKHGFPQVLVIDEADALLPHRSGRHTASGIEQTTVPQFLAEMDGFHGKNPILILATNLPHALDPAVTREGRIDMHLKIPRPNETQAERILGVYVNKVKLHDACKMPEITQIVTKAVFADEVLKSNVSGAMLAEVVKGASRAALKRDQKAKVRQASGIGLDDFNTSLLRLREGRMA